jgi:hypothetical protein
MSQNKIKFRLEEFLREGTLRPVSFGMSDSEVKALLGEPDFEFRTRKKKRPSGFEYGYLEFYFTDHTETHMNQLCGISLDNFDSSSGLQKIEIDYWFLTNGITHAESEQHLKEAEISFQSASETRLNRKILQTSSGVELHFDEEEKLSYLGKSVRSEIETEKVVKQVSVIIPIKIYEKIRQESLRQRQSISKICSNWIIEKAGHLSD